MSESVNTACEKRVKAIDRYKSQVEWYEKTKTDARRWFYWGQTVVVILTGIAPLVILATEWKPLQALFPAVASIVAGLLGIWQLQDSWQRRAIALEALKSEFAKFDTRSGEDYRPPVTEDQAIERFVLKTEEIVGNEVAEWHRQRRKVSKSKTNGAGS